MSDDFDDNENTESYVPLIKGTSVQHYKIIDKIGAGGMGEVYLAEDTRLNRQVALKFLPVHLCPDKDCRARFKREAQAAAKLNHPNIITIYEVGEFSGRPYFAMEQVEGKSLRDIIKAEELSIKEIIGLSIQICEGLHEAHDAGVIHRDIKPANIIVDDKKRLRLLDFGLAAVGGTEKLTKTGSTLGTVGYMSPEQVRGEELDARSDLFSFGVILYEMITGRLPFKEDYEAATFNAILNESPEPMRRFKADVPDDLQTIVDKAMDKDKETRYQTAAGILADLKRFKKEKDSSEILSSVRQPEEKGNRKYFIPGLIIVVAVLILIFKPWKLELSSDQSALAVENRLAIMYFDDLSESEGSQKMGEIATNLLIADLSESQFVQVVSSQRLYDILKLLGHEGEKKIDSDVASQVAEKARARWMLLGSILQAEPQIILMAQLVEVESGTTVASQKITGDENEKIFSIVDKLTVEIKNDLSLPAKAQEEADLSIADVTTHSPEAYGFYLEGIEMGFKHFYREAKASFEKALEHDSTFAMAYFQLSSPGFGSLSERKKMMAKAVEFSDGAGQKDKYYIRFGQAFLDREKEQAIEELQKLIKRYPDEKLAYFMLGIVYYGLQQNQKAIIYFNKAIEIDSLFADSYNHLAYAYNKIGEFEKSIWAINKYIEIAPDEPNPYDTRAEIYALNGKLDEAIASYEKANEIKSNYSLSRLADLYLFKRKYAKAESLYQIMASDPDKYTRGAGRIRLAYIPMHQGRFKDALRMFEVGIEADLMEKNEFSTLNKIVGRMLIFATMGDLEQWYFEGIKSLELIEKLKITGIQILARGDQAAYYVKTGDFAKADSIMQQLYIMVDTTNMEHLDYLYFAQGWYNFVLGNYDSAAIYFEKTNQIIPAFNDQIMLARSYYESGRLGDAVAMFEQAMKRYEFNRAMFLLLSIRAHYWLGLTYEASGWNDKAIEQYEIFLDIWKNSDSGIVEIDDAKERLARLTGKS